MRLEGKLAIVTGSAMGIGRAIALRLARDGADVALLDRDLPGLEAVAAEISSLGRRASLVAADLTNDEAVTEAFVRLHEERGAPDILVNNVGQSARERASEFWCAADGVAEFVIDISLMTTIRCTAQVVPQMRERGSGKIINISSEAAYIGSVNATFYAAAKAGVLGFTRSLARELAPFHVNVNAVAPGYTRTGAIEKLPPALVQKAIAEIPLGFVGEPEDIANVVAFFASDESRYVTGQSLLVNGGRWMN